MLMCGDDKTYGAYYFEFADPLDVTFLAGEFADGRPGDDVAEEILSSMNLYATDFLKACHAFQQMLWDQKVNEHSY